MYNRRQRSPPSGRSILITRAPRSASRSDADGPARNWLKSITKSPSRGLIKRPPLHHLARFATTHSTLLTPSCYLLRSPDTGEQSVPPHPETQDSYRTSAADMPHRSSAASSQRTHRYVDSPLHPSTPFYVPAVRQHRSRLLSAPRGKPQTTHTLQQPHACAFTARSPTPPHPVSIANDHLHRSRQDRQ